MIDTVSLLVVFLFMLALIGGAAYSGFVYARWQNKRTKQQIEAGFDRLRDLIRRTSS